MAPTANPAPTKDPDDEGPKLGAGEGDPAERHPEEPRASSPTGGLGHGSEEGRDPVGGEGDGGDDVEAADDDIDEPREDEPGVSRVVLDGDD